MVRHWYFLVQKNCNLTSLTHNNWPFVKYVQNRELAEVFLWQSQQKYHTISVGTSVCRSTAFAKKCSVILFQNTSTQKARFTENITFKLLKISKCNCTHINLHKYNAVSVHATTAVLIIPTVFYFLITFCEQVVKVIWQDRITAADGWLNHIHQVAPTSPPMWAHWHHLANTIELASIGPPESTTQTANRSVKPFLHSSRHKSLYFTMGDPFPKIAPSHGGIWT